MPRLVLYSRAGCHLCEDMAAGLQPLLRERALALEIVDIDTDAALRARYDLRIPVLTLDGDLVCEGRLDESVLRDALRIP